MKKPAGPVKGRSPSPRYRVSSDPAETNVRRVHQFLLRSYWAQGIPLRLLRKALRNSLCFGAFLGREQVAFARVVTDRATFAYVCDVFVDEAHRGRELSKQMMKAMLAHPDLQGLRRWHLVTVDAQGLYRQFGFRPVAHPKRHMEIHRPAIYLRTSPRRKS